MDDDLGYYLPNSATRQCEQHNTDCGVFPEPLDHVLSILLRHLAIESHTRNGSLREPGFNELKGKPPSGEDDAKGC